MAGTAGLGRWRGGGGDAEEPYDGRRPPRQSGRAAGAGEGPSASGRRSADSAHW